MEERGRTSMVYYFHKDSEEESYFRTQLEEHGAAIQYRDPVALFSPSHHAQFPVIHGHRLHAKLYESLSR